MNLIQMQKYPRGRRGSPAKGVGGLNRARVQIPPSAPHFFERSRLLLQSTSLHLYDKMRVCYLQLQIYWGVEMSIIIQMTKEFALDISNWTYETPYSRYSFQSNSETIYELLNGDYYAFVNAQNELLGYFCFGKSAQIPIDKSDAYTEDALDIGLGMKPPLCGKGLGSSFLNAGIDFAQNKFQPNKYRLTVASFNKRAIRLYKKAGFTILRTVTHCKSHDEFYMMVLQKQE